MNATIETHLDKNDARTLARRGERRRKMRQDKRERHNRGRGWKPVDGRDYDSRASRQYAIANGYTRRRARTEIEQPDIQAETREAIRREWDDYMLESYFDEGALAVRHFGGDADLIVRYFEHEAEYLRIWEDLAEWNNEIGEYTLIVGKLYYSHLLGERVLVKHGGGGFYSAADELVYPAPECLAGDEIKDTAGDRFQWWDLHGKAHPRIR